VHWLHLAQQATQLAGLLPGLGGAVVGISLSLIGMAYQMNKATSSTRQSSEKCGGVK
jgi:archaellum biogenesis protein FlaJ (TadC family)